MMYPNPFMHTTTTGGGALACSAAIAAINVTLARPTLGGRRARKAITSSTPVENFAE
jgi:acetylornithine/succinyldiaminopimelate/putrescine aminotransferase